jgi:uncharacterized lipoprotein YehR (DUF1307 family)
MALPKLIYPTFELTIPSTKEKCKFRPFLVKEEKLLLMAKQSAEQNDIVNAIAQVITNCDVESKLDPEKLASFDIEYLFLRLRAKSVNNIIDLTYTDYEDEQTYKFQVDAEDIQIVYNENHNNVIRLTDESGIVMKYPSIKLMRTLLEDENIDDLLFFMIRGCMDMYFDGDNVTKFSECTKEEVDEFIDSLPTTVLKNLEEFFDTMPKMYYKIEYTNSKGTDRVIELKSLEDFFTLR